MKMTLHAVNENNFFLTFFHNLKLLPFVHLSAKKLELYEAPNSPIVRLKVSYYCHCYFRQKLWTTERDFPFA